MLPARRYVPLLPLAAFLLMADPSAGQLVPLRTVPVASGEQGFFLPSLGSGMGDVGVAVDDTLADPWSQPARGARLRGATLLSSPTLYGISDGGGGGRTFPVAAVAGGRRWFGGVALALQQIDNEAARGDLVFIDPLPWFGPAERLSDRSLRNLYARGFLGRRLGRGPWSAGLGISLSDLDAVDGVDLLYARADRIEQDGSVKDVRLGLFRDAPDQRLSFLLVHNRVDVTHDVTFIDVVWPADPPAGRPWEPTVERRVEVNEDRTRTWGVQAAWDKDLAAPGWRLGLAATANRKSHPAIPDYDIQNIPRDPGTTWAWEAEAGVARTRGGTTFALEVAVQPIWSETWQEAEEQVETAEGRVLRPGDHTIDNDFFFTNVVLRAGLAQRLDRLVMRAGVEARSYDYELEQRDHVAGTFRTQDEAWMEWTPTAGLSWRFSDVEVAWVGRLTTGTGQPGVAGDAAVMEAVPGADFILAPSGPLTLQDATVTTHQISVRIPIR